MHRLIACALGFVILVLLLPHATADEPKYEGKLVSAWIKDLKDREPRVRLQSLAALDQLGAQAAPALPSLLEVLAKDPNAEVRSETATVLSKLFPKSDQVITALGKACRDENLEVRVRVLAALGDLGAAARTVVPAVLEALKEPGLATTAAHALLAIDPDNKDALPLMVELLQSKNPGERRLAAGVLEIFGPRAAPAVPVLAKALQDDDPFVRIRTLYAFRSMGPAAREAVPDLVARLTVSDRRARFVAAQALVKVDPTNAAAVPILMARVKDRDPLVYAMELAPVAGQAIAPLFTGQFNRNAAAEVVFLPNRLEYIDRLVSNNRITAIIALGELGPVAQRALPVLAEAMRDPDERVREKAAEALSKIDPKRAAP